MFAVVLKNTFIVCIGNFLIDNHLNEIEIESKNASINDELKEKLPIPV